jgi:hypothetical protein
MTSRSAAKASSPGVGRVCERPCLIVAKEATVLNAREATQIFGGYRFFNDTRSPVSGVTQRSSR